MLAIHHEPIDIVKLQSDWIGWMRYKHELNMSARTRLRASQQPGRGTSSIPNEVEIARENEIDGG